MIASTIPPSAAAWMIWARSLWWVEKPTNFALPDFRIASAVSLNSWLLTKLMASSRRVVVAEAVDEEEVDVVGPQGLPAAGRASSASARGACGVSLVTRKICLRTSGVLLEPLLEAGLGAVDLGGVEEADAVGEGEPEQAVGRSCTRSLFEHRDLDAGLAQLPLGSTASRATTSWAPEAGARLTAEAVASAPAWKKRTAIGAGLLIVGHRCRLLVGGLKIATGRGAQLALCCSPRNRVRPVGPESFITRRLSLHRQRVTNQSGV